MNKFGIVLGAAAVVTLAGCKDTDYKYANAPASQSAVKSVETTPAVSTPIVATAVKPAPEPVPVVAEPEFTEYIVQEGDYLSKISKRYNVTMSSIYRLNPSIKKDVIRVGQKIKLPGTIDVGVQTAPAKTSGKSVKATKKSGSTAAYTGATKEYVVKSGDTLGSVAYGNGLNIRQLKQLNGLTSDTLKIGQKLKIPAEKVAKSATASEKKTETAAPAKKVETAAPAPAVDAAPVVEEKKAEAPVPAAESAAAAPAPAAPATMTYIVQEGDDMTGVSIRWGVPVSVIRELNNLGENDQLVPNQVIKLPADAQQ